VFATVEEMKAKQEKFQVDRTVTNASRTARLHILSNMVSRVPNFKVIEILQTLATLSKLLNEASAVLTPPTIESLGDNRRLGNAVYPLVVMVEYREYTDEACQRITTKLLEFDDADLMSISNF
jgi:hypothetical protein